MKKLCPNCEKNNSEDAEYCYNCGYKFYTEQNNEINNIFKNGKIFLILIIIVLLIGTIIITTTNNNTDLQETQENNNIHVTITEVKGENYSDNGYSDYSYFAKVILSNLPINEEEDGTLDGLILQTTYYTNDSQKIGETKEAINEMIDIYDYQYDKKTSTPTLWTRFFDTTDNRIPSTVTVAIIDQNNNVISQDHYTVNGQHVYDI